jgi:7-carboxy-7-deazaguanine synthase (Cx14CxxC type)
MTYAVKEIFYTLQGEGVNAGRPAVFCRFSGCNLWSGKESDRLSAQCSFCDTDFVGTDGLNGGKFESAELLAQTIGQLWPAMEAINKLVVFTGGEPLLQVDTPLIAALHARNFRCAVETNGTLPAPPDVDWITLSPKGTARLRVSRANEIKLVYPQSNALPPQFDALIADHYFLQPMDGPDRERNTKLAVEYCLAHPRWRLSLQTHKYLGIP